MSSGRLNLRSRTRYSLPNGDPTSRVKSAQETLNDNMVLCEKVGISRISNVTYMDRLYIPNYSVVLPGTEDTFWVYSGKGTTNYQAKASALMEALERYSSLSNARPRDFIQGTYSQLARSYDKVLHPDEVVEPASPEYDEQNTILDYLEGFDLLNNENVLVPAELALYRYSPQPPARSIFSESHTNGLASGNVLEEAIYHALCEVIERDAISIADLCSSSIPYSILENIRWSLERSNPFIDRPGQSGFVDDPSIFPNVDISDIAKEFEPVKFLVKRFSTANIPLLIKDITQEDISVPTFLASSIEWITEDYGYFAKGFGTDLDPRIALTRAITELSQTRVVNIHGARDDLKKIKYTKNDDIYNRKWQFMLSSPPQRRHDRNIASVSGIKTVQHDDILAEITYILHRLNNAGLRRAIIVDLTDPQIGVPVVRAIVPGLETFEVTKSIMGTRAKKYFQNLRNLKR